MIVANRVAVAQVVPMRWNLRVNVSHRNAPSVGPLIERLGDESKVVQRAAAEAVRAIGNRANADGPRCPVPALEDESGSQAVALDEAGAGELESSDFDLTLGADEESGDTATAFLDGSQVVRVPASPAQAT